MISRTIIFSILLIIAVIIFIWNTYKRFGLITLGKPENRFDHPLKRTYEMLVYAFGQKRVISRPYGFNHFIIFWAFIILLIANLEFIIQGIFPTISLSILPQKIYYPVSWILEVISFITLLSICVAIIRRTFFAPAYLSTQYVKAKSFQAFLILSFIALLMIAYFGMHTAEIALGIESKDYHRPISSHLANLLPENSEKELEFLKEFFWWLHAVVLLGFLNFLPLSKHMHIMTSIPNCYFKSLEKPNTQPREEFKKENVYGVGRVDLFTWKDLFDSYSCTECGRCQDVCPATNTDKPLNPRQIIHAIKVNLIKNGPLLKSGKAPAIPLIGKEDEGTNTEDAIWACTTCGACMEVCPVFIEQMPKIIKMRRHLVEMEAKFPEELLNLFENMEQRSNPWGIAPAERAKWTTGLNVKTFTPNETEYLFFVGCAGAFDSRNKQVTISLAKILNSAGISWGILGKDEKCCGDSLRRLGNEYIFDKIVKENIKLFQERGIKKVITQCPHCFSTLKNDYKQYGIELEVIHHSEFINRLLEEGKLKLDQKISDYGKIIFHDSCYLGRHNDIYDAPRQIIKITTKNDPLEFSRNKTNSFCCGGGGGRMWMEEHIGKRINITRVKEALTLNPNTLCVTCPYCLTMFEDGLKDEKAENVRVKDVAEIVASNLK